MCKKAVNGFSSALQSHLPPQSARTTEATRQAVWGPGPCWSGAQPRGHPARLPGSSAQSASHYSRGREPASTADCQREKALTDGAGRRFNATGSTEGDGCRPHLNQSLAELPGDSLNLTELRPSAVMAKAASPLPPLPEGTVVSGPP